MSLEAVQQSQQSQQPQEKLSNWKRAAITLAPLPSAIAIFTSEIIKTDQVSESADAVIDTFKQTHKENMEQIKENIHETAEQTRKMGPLRYLFGLIPIIEKIDEDINN